MQDGGTHMAGLYKQTIAERIKEVKEKQKYSQTPRLSNVGNPVTQSNFAGSQRSRSIDPRAKRNSNPFSMGGVAAARTMSNSQVVQTQMNDVARRFKNISDREAPANHLSDKYYAAAQNQSLYNNAYQFVGSKSQEKL